MWRRHGADGPWVGARNAKALRAMVLSEKILSIFNQVFVAGATNKPPEKTKSGPENVRCLGKHAIKGIKGPGI